MTATTEQVDAAALVQQCLDEIRSARLAAGAATAAKARATQAVKAAHNDRLAAAEAKARGHQSADEPFDAATDRLREATEQLERAQAEDEGAARVIRNAEARLAQVRKLHFPELAAQIDEDHVAAVVAAADALAAPLAAYLRAYERAAAAYRPLGPAAQAQIVAADREEGRYRDLAAVMEDASIPECPLPANAVELARTLLPRPRFMTRGRSGAGVQIINVDVADVGE